MRELREIHLDTILALLAAMERSNGVVLGVGFGDLTADECSMIWRQRLKPDGTPRFTMPKPVNRFAKTDYDPIDE